MLGRISLAILCGVVALSLVEAQPEIIKPDKQPVYAQAGMSFKLVCRYNDPTGDGVTWYHDGSQINVQSNSNFVVYADTEEEDSGRITYSHLTKNEVNEADEGNYECRPKKGGAGTGYMTSVTVVTVLTDQVENLVGLNRVKRQTEEDLEAENATLEVGKDAELTCRIVGDFFPKKSFKWFRAEDREKELVEGEKYKINQDNGSLVIKHAREDDAGQYVCVYNMEDGGTFETIVSLNSVPFVQKFDSKSKNLVQGDPLTINCKVNSEPAPVISWYKDDTPLDTSDPRVKLSEYDGLTNASLRIEDLDFDDRALYMCSATNDIGTGNNTIMVRVKDKLAALWPFLGICAEVVILCTIIFIYEKRRAKKMEEEDMPEEAGHLTNSHDHKGKEEIRQRK